MLDDAASIVGASATTADGPCPAEESVYTTIGMGDAGSGRRITPGKAPGGRPCAVYMGAANGYPTLALYCIAAKYAGAEMTAMIGARAPVAAREIRMYVAPTYTAPGGRTGSCGLGETRRGGTVAEPTIKVGVATVTAGAPYPKNGPSIASGEEDTVALPSDPPPRCLAHGYEPATA